MMARWRVIVVGLVVALAAPTARAQTPFRIAIDGSPPGPCAPVAAAAPAGLKAYAAHLEARLERPIAICPTANRAEAAALLARGGADLATLDAASWPQAGAARAILTPRTPQEFGRVEMTALVPASAKRQTLQDLAGARAVLSGTVPVAAEGPFRALADHGFSRDRLGAVTQAGDPEAAVATLRAGGADVMLLHVAAWGRLCRGVRPGDEPCKDLRMVWRGRPLPREAIVVPTATPAQLRYRLIGIHIAMHLEAPEAFAWAARGAPGAVSFDAAEAGALAIGAR